MTEYYKSKRTVDGKPPIWVIVDENGKVVNKNPSKEELKGLQKELRTPQDTKKRHKKYCDRCKEYGKDTKLSSGKAWREYDKGGNFTGRWVCGNCYQKYDPSSSTNLIRSVANVRTGNDNPSHSNAKGKKSQKLACRLYGWVDLNEENDNYRTPIDCYDPKTGLYHQVQGRYYNSERGYWSFDGFEDEWEKIFEDMVCFCISKNGKIVERIYIFPQKEIEIVKGIAIVKNPTKGGWYKTYRITDEEELKKANEIWKTII